MAKITNSTEASATTSTPSQHLIDPEWDKAIAELSQHCKQNGVYARTLIKGGSLIIKERKR